MAHHGDTISSDFKKKHEVILESLGDPRRKPKTAYGDIMDDISEDLDDADKSSTSRVFRGYKKSAVLVKSILDSAPRCEICNGRMHHGQPLQIDHVVEHRHNGPTMISNGRPTHNFCNNMRSQIEALKEDPNLIGLPSFDLERTVSGQFVMQFEFTVEGEEISSINPAISYESAGLLDDAEGTDD